MGITLIEFFLLLLRMLGRFKGFGIEEVAC